MIFGFRSRRVLRKWRMWTLMCLAIKGEFEYEFEFDVKISRRLFIYLDLDSLASLMRRCARSSEFKIKSLKLIRSDQSTHAQLSARVCHSKEMLLHCRLSPKHSTNPRKSFTSLSQDCRGDNQSENALYKAFPSSGR